MLLYWAIVAINVFLLICLVTERISAVLYSSIRGSHSALVVHTGNPKALNGL